MVNKSSMLEKDGMMKMENEFWPMFDHVMDRFLVYFELIFNKPNGNTNG
jgi:hypothetical protein